MKTLYLERSTGTCRDGNWAEDLDLVGVERIVVGTGPGSFAGIRSALAFAQGYALATKCEVLGLPSACAIAAQVLSDSARITNHEPRTTKLAVVGDARQGKAWIALFEGYSLEKDVFQVNYGELCDVVPADCKVVTPDAARIDELLRGTFGDRYLGDRTPTTDGLRCFAEQCPSILRPEPLPIYLNPAVRSFDYSPVIRYTSLNKTTNGRAHYG